MLKTLLVTTLAVGWLTSLAVADEPIEHWSERHPEASQALGAWVKARPDAAAKFFEWDAHHPRRSQAFVTWTIEHPTERIDVYVSQHPKEPYLGEIMKNHRLATEEFMVWSRNHGDAARDLMAHPKALDWAGHHLYQAYWHLEGAAK